MAAGAVGGGRVRLGGIAVSMGEGNTLTLGGGAGDARVACCGGARLGSPGVGREGVAGGAGDDPLILEGGGGGAPPPPVFRAGAGALERFGGVIGLNRPGVGGIARPGALPEDDEPLVVGVGGAGTDLPDESLSGREGGTAVAVGVGVMGVWRAGGGGVLDGGADFSMLWSANVGGGLGSSLAGIPLLVPWSAKCTIARVKTVGYKKRK